MESDIGTFKPLGLKFTGSKKAKKVMSKILSLLKSINATVLEVFTPKNSFIFY